MSSDSSSSDDDAAMFAAVAVSADDLSQQAERSKQVRSLQACMVHCSAPAPPPAAAATTHCRQHESETLVHATHPARSQLTAQRQARARQRRAGGGGILGTLTSDGGDGNGSGDEGDSIFLDAAQLKVAAMLQERIKQELDLEEAPASAPSVTLPAVETADSEPSDGVRLFRRVKAGVPLVERRQQQQQQAQPQGGQHEQQQEQQQVSAAAPGQHRTCRWLEEPTKKRCRAAMVEAADVEAAAAEAARQAAPNIASRTNWVPADDDPSRLSHRRKRRAAKLAAEAHAWKIKDRAARRAEQRAQQAST